MNASAARVVRRSDYRSSPWRNGGGVTHEIARAPQSHGQSGAEFAWRLSLAHIDGDGPFSDFRGYQRAITLVSGGACRLLGLRKGGWELRESGSTALFDGGAAVSCELLAGPCEDLNLMVREPGQIVAVDHFALFPSEPDAVPANCNVAVFCLEGAIDCLHLPSGERATLGLHDSLLIEPHDAAAWRLLRGAAGSARAIVHAWRTA